MWEVIATHGIFSKQKTNTEHEPFAPNRGNPDAVFNTSIERNGSNCTASISANALVGAAVRIMYMRCICSRPPGTQGFFFSAGRATPTAGQVHIAA